MASNDTPKTVLLKGDPLADEATGAGAILPGHLLERDSAGTVSVHSVASGRAIPMFAREEEYVGGALETAYAAGDRIAYYIGRSGDQFYAILEDGHNVAIGAYLESAGDGTLQPVTPAAQDTDSNVTFPGNAVVRAVQAVNTSGGAVATARIKVEVI